MSRIYEFYRIRTCRGLGGRLIPFLFTSSSIWSGRAAGEFRLTAVARAGALEKPRPAPRIPV